MKKSKINYNKKFIKSKVKNGAKIGCGFRKKGTKRWRKNWLNDIGKKWIKNKYFINKNMKIKKYIKNKNKKYIK